MNQTNRRRYILPAVILVLFVALLAGFIQTLRKNLQPPQESVAIVGPPEYIDPNADPIQANIGVYITSVGNLELATGNYFMDFYLTIQCDRPCQPDPDILNAASAPEITRQNADTRGDTFHFYRVRANLLTDVYLEKSPFDEQVLKLSIGDKQATKSEMEFVDDPGLTGWDYGHIHLLGWSVRQKLDTFLTEDAYPGNQGGLYSRYNLSLTVFKPWFSSFFSDIFPALVIMLVGLLSFLMSPEAAGERLALTSSTLLALILFHINLNSSLPSLGSLTYADKFMIVNYLTASLSTAISAILMVLRDSKDIEAANKLSGWTRWVVPPLWASFLLVTTIWQFNGPQVLALLNR